MNTVKDLIDALSKLNQDAKVLFPCNFNVYDTVTFGYSRFNELKVVKLVETKSDWFEESSDPKAFEAITFQ